MTQNAEWLSEPVRRALVQFRNIRNQLEQEGWNDDRRLFINIYSQVENIAEESPVTTTGKIALDIFALEKTGELRKLYVSLGERKMLPGQQG